MENKPESEPQTQMQAQGPTVVCRKCRSVESAEQTYCTNCGEPLKGAMKTSRTRTSGSGLGSLVDDQHRKHIRRARIAIMFVAVVTLLFAIFKWYMLEKEIAEVQASSYMVVDQAVVAQNRLIIGVTFAIGLIFMSLFFWAKTNPFGAALTALIIYITDLIVSVGLDPKNLARGLLVKIIIIIVLANGVKSGLAYKKERMMNNE